MTQSFYSWMGSPLHLVLVDEFATTFNRATEKFFSAQLDFKARTGSDWTGSEQIKVDWTEEELKAYNKMGDLVNFLVEFNGGSLDIGEDAMTSSFLVKL